MMDTFFAIAQVIGKLLFYIAVASLVGGYYISSLLQRFRKSGHGFIEGDNRRWLVATLVLGIVGTLVFFFAQVGAFAEAGWAGMFEPFYFELVWRSGVGEAVRWRVGLLVVALGVILLTAKFSAFKQVYGISKGLLILIIAGLIWSFTLLGHTVEQDWSIQLALMIHVLLMAWWVGSLWPLSKACQQLEPEPLYQLMHHFGQSASWVVATLFVAGMYLLYAINGLAPEAFFQPYGLGLLSKLFFVGGLLLLAARHKWNLVPALQEKSSMMVQKSRVKLGRSIALEWVLATLVLTATAVFTTLISPVH